jgi:protein-disulfide isomerase
MNRRHILQMGMIFSGAALAGGLGPRLGPIGSRRVFAAEGDEPPKGLYPDEHILGDPEAPITIIEYSSLTCPHCAAFHRETLPTLEEEWIEPGKAKLAYRHFPLDRLALAAAVVANCSGEKRFFKFLEVLFQKQMDWARSDDPIAEIKKYAAFAGMSGSEVDECLADKAMADRVLQRQVDGNDAFNIQSTPTFWIHGEKVEGAQPFETFDEVLKGI